MSAWYGLPADFCSTKGRSSRRDCRKAQNAHVAAAHNQCCIYAYRLQHCVTTCRSIRQCVTWCIRYMHTFTTCGWSASGAHLFPTSPLCNIARRGTVSHCKGKRSSGVGRQVNKLASTSCEHYNCKTTVWQLLLSLLVSYWVMHSTLPYQHQQL
jgi:hypothetical protein